MLNRINTSEPIVFSEVGRGKPPACKDLDLVHCMCWGLSLAILCPKSLHSRDSRVKGRQRDETDSTDSEWLLELCFAGGQGGVVGPAADGGPGDSKVEMWQEP